MVIRGPKRNMTTSISGVSMDSQKNKLRIAILGPCYLNPFESYLNLDNTPLPKGMGGYNITHLILARISQGLPTDVITCDPSILDIIRFKGDILRLWVVPRRTRGLLRDLYKSESTLLLKAIRESNADCLHANWITEYALAASRSNTPWILSLHDHPASLLRWISIGHIISFSLSIWLIQKAPIITGVSPYVCEFVRNFGKKSAVCIPNLIHLSLLNIPHEINNKSVKSFHTIVSVLNWSKFKNVKNGLIAFHKLLLILPNTRLLLIGPNLGEGELAEKWAISKHVSENVSFLGKIPYSECIKYISNADMLFHPALEEAMGCQVAEAMLMGTPVVCTKQAKGPKWLINNGKYGLITDGRKPEKMAKDIKRILTQNRKQRKTLCLIARKYIKSITDENLILNQYKTVYLRSIKK